MPKRAPRAGAAERARRAQLGSPSTQSRTWAERQRRAAAVEAWRAEHGDWCPGWAYRPAHVVIPPNVLTADHLEPVGSGGDPTGPLVVRCRRCNSARGARW